MTYSLVCEGRCNPMLKHADQLVETWAKQEANANRLYGSIRVQKRAPLAYYWQRSLVHTPHAMVTAERAQCLTCGCQRRYGADESAEQAA